MLDALRASPLARLVVDEAYCISEWGHDFRPDYLALKGIVESLGRPPLTAVTATATRRVQQSILANLGMDDPRVLVGGFKPGTLSPHSRRLFPTAGSCLCPNTARGPSAPVHIQST